jgi:hypothetical protein
MKQLVIFLSLFFIVSIPDSVSASITEYGKVPVGGGVINVKSLGAKGDGVQDDTPFINSAIAQTRYPNLGNVVYLPAGTYLVTGINASQLNGTTIIGDGAELTKIVSAGFEGPIIDTLGSNYLTIAKIRVGLRPNSTADAGIVLSASGPTASSPVGASSTANTIDQVVIEDDAVSASFNIATVLVANSGDNYITDSRFVSHNKSTTPALLFTGNASALGLRSQYATVLNPAVHDTHGAIAPTDNTFIKVVLRKEKAGQTGALLMQQAEARFFNSSIESADMSGVVITNTAWRNGFYNTQIVPINQTQFSDACIKLPNQSASLQIQGLTFDPRSCNSSFGPLNFANQAWLFRILYPNQAFTRDFKGNRDVLANNVPVFYVEPQPFPPAPAPFNGSIPSQVSPSPVISPTPSPSPSPTPSPSPSPSPTPCANPSVDFGSWSSAGTNMLYQVYVVVNGVEYNIGYIGESQRFYVWQSGVVGNTYRFVVKWVAPDGRYGTHMTQDLKMFCP